jgi:hypothetical protein
MISSPRRGYRGDLAAALLLIALLPLRAADGGADILRHWSEAQRNNEERTRQYTYTEQADRFTYGPDGNLRKDSIETAEVIVVERIAFHKLVARNGNPLDAKEQARVDKEMRQTAEERRKHRQQPPAGGRISFGSQWADLGSREELLSMFDNRLLGEEMGGGRKAWVFESTPNAGVVATNEHEHDVLCFRKRLWIDQADYVMAKAVYTVIGDYLFAKPGSTLTFAYEKIGPDTWHETSVILDIYRVRNKAFQPSGRTEYRMSGFRKFDVETTITVDSGK